MIDELHTKTKNMFGKAASLVEEYLDKHKKPEVYIFLQFEPKPTISAYEVMQVFCLNNTLMAMYGTAVTPLNPIFMSSQIYYSLDPDMLKNHFVFIASESMDLNDAYDKINNSVM